MITRKWGRPSGKEGIEGTRMLQDREEEGEVSKKKTEEVSRGEVRG